MTSRTAPRTLIGMNFTKKSRHEGQTTTWLYQRHLAACKGGKRCKCPWWIRGYIHGKPLRESLQTDRMDIALERQRRLEAEGTSAADPSPAVPPSTTAGVFRPTETSPMQAETHPLEQLIERYIQRRVSSADIVASTQTEYSICYRKFREFAERRGATTVEALTAELIEDYLDQPRYKQRTKFKHFRHLTAIFKFASKRYKLDLMSLLPDDPPSVPKDGAHRPLSNTEQALILKTCDRSKFTAARDRAIMLTLLCTGLRAVDVRSKLLWTSIDWQRRQISVLMQKTRRHRMHPLVIPNLPPVFFDALRALPRPIDPNTPVFGHSIDAFRSIIQVIAKHSGVKFSAHDCRVTFAVERLASGASMWDVSQLLGHSSTAVTERYYIKWVQSLDQRLANVMGNADFSHLERTGS